MQEVDLLIIGSGPAGLSTALHLLQQEAGCVERMVLVEKEAHPRPKLCAGGVTRIGLENMRDLGMQLPLPISSVEISEARLVYQGRMIRMRGQPEFVVYNRIEFDAFLSQFARQQGIVIHENEAVQTITFKPDGVEVITSQEIYSAKVIVGADGSKGVTRRLVNKLGPKGRVARVIETVNPAQETQAPFADRYAIFDLTPCLEGLQGYYWEFPSIVAGKQSLNRGVYDSRLASRRERADLPEILNAQTANDLIHSPEANFQGHPLNWFSPRNRFSMPRLLLVGDAAGADPLFGEGIGPGLAYGMIASEVLNDAFRKKDFSLRFYKPRLLTSVVGRYLLFRWWWAWLSYHFSWSQIFMYALLFVGKVVAKIRPRPGPLYASDTQKTKRSADDQFKSSVK